MNRTRTKVAAVLMAGLVLGAAACGSSSKNDASSNGDAIKSSDATTTSTTARSTTTTSGSSSSGLDSLGGAGDCLQAAGAYAAVSLQLLQYLGGATQSQISDLESQIGQLKAEIPSAIQSDFDTYSAGIKAYADAMQGVDMSNILDPSVQSKLEAAGNALDTPEMKTAQANIEAYFDKNCN